ncbi:MAG: hypothetical protein HN457_17720 [Opitutales bacterium]|jgi:ribosomal protein RSM22 (predicted rRNA methylase)|nr:hypothetical protein [Opitutales bacterium]MBT5814054.1 hypothetical protein [Opitutales bacterium]
MNIDTVDWNTLERLRSEFLAAKGNTGVYWKSPSDLAHYQRFFAARIGWKWDAALLQARQAGWQLQSRRLLDWGCGSGIATLRFLDTFGTDCLDEVVLWDHSTLACEFARNAILERHPQIAVSIANPSSLDSLDDTICLISHVLNELSLDARAELTELACSAKQVFWVEPGSHLSSRLLLNQREAMLERFHPIAPCVCAKACPMRNDDNLRHWCHFFAKTPMEAFMDGDWAQFAKIMEIDLRSLPYSFICMDAQSLASVPKLDGHSRVLGRPRQFKGYSKVFSCDANGLSDYELQKRDDKPLWKSIKKGKDGSLYQWTDIDSGRIRSGNSAKEKCS